MQNGVAVCRPCSPRRVIGTLGLARLHLLNPFKTSSKNDRNKVPNHSEAMKDQSPPHEGTPVIVTDNVDDNRKWKPVVWQNTPGVRS